MSAALKQKSDTPKRKSNLLGYVADPDALFAKEKRLILDKIGDLSGIRIPLNRILVAIWTTEQERRTESGLILHTSDKSKDENKWQGVSALVLKMGPHAYESDANVTYLPEDKCEVGDWVMFRRGEGVRVEVWNHECMILEEASIKAILDRPDAVF